MRPRVLFLVFGGVLALATPAFADSSSPAPQDERRAERLFGEGEAAFEAGDYRRAAKAFEAAYAAKRHPAVLWNAALSWQRAGEDLLAARHLERYLRDASSDAPHRDEATKALALLLKRVGRAQLQNMGVKRIMVDGTLCPDATTLLAPGEHVATAETDSGEVVKKLFVVQAGDTISVILAPDRSENGSAKRGSGLSPLFVLGGGVLVAAGASVSIFSGLDTVQKAQDFDRNPSANRLDAGYVSQARTNVAIGVTAGLAALTLATALFFVDWGGGRPRKTSGQAQVPR